MQRKRLNLAKDKPRVSRSRFWQKLLMCLLTTQQKSGPGSQINRCLRQRSFPLTYSRVKRSKDPRRLALRELKRWPGIRRVPTIARQIESNLQHLEDGNWKRLLREVNSLRGRADAEKERAVAAILASELEGLGPKQSRNLLQALGLTRYEVPIDSRLVKWLNEFGFPFKLTAATLSSPDHFDLVSQGFQELCRAAGAYPCVVDAAIFSSFDD